MSTAAGGDMSESLSDIDDAERVKNNESSDAETETEGYTPAHQLFSRALLSEATHLVAGYLNSKEAAQFKRMIWEVMNKDYDKGKSRKRARKAKKAAPEKRPEKAVTTVVDAKKRLSSKINFDAFSKLNEDLQSDEKKKSLAGSRDDEFEHENTYSEEAEARQGYHDDTYFANEEYNAYNYDEGYNFDELDS